MEEQEDLFFMVDRVSGQVWMEKLDTSTCALMVQAVNRVRTQNCSKDVKWSRLPGSRPLSDHRCIKEQIEGLYIIYRNLGRLGENSEHGTMVQHQDRRAKG